MSKYGVISGPYFPAFGLNTEIYAYSVRINCSPEISPYLDTFHASRFSPNTEKYAPEITPYLGTFQATAFSQNTGKYGAEITPYLGTFHAVKYYMQQVLLQYLREFPRHN